MNDVDTYFAKAHAIRKGELDNEMPRYDELAGWLQRVPDTWLPGLLRRTVTLCVMKRVFREGGLESTVQAAKEVGENPMASILRD